ncbi:MAG: GNAT family N-acetyltransferase [Candidatus Shapirobacteria bacterium]|nr:GNAT family N-acetyltransferase [Candidatus Shapirobacteria bacterium]
MVENINKSEMVSQEIRVPKTVDLIGLKKIVADDKKPYIEEIIESLKTSDDENEKLLGFYNRENIMVGMAYFLEEDNNSIYLSRLITAENYQHHGIASSLVSHLKSRYDFIRTIPVPLGNDFNSDSKTIELKEFYKKRGFDDGRMWMRRP